MGHLPRCSSLRCGVQLDAGVEERIMLVARDEQSCLVVTYKEVKRCLEGAFGCVLPCLFVVYVDADPRL